MAEPNEEEYNTIIQLFLDSYNEKHSSDYELSEIDSGNKNDWDFLCKNNSGEVLKVQHTAAVSVYGKELSKFHQFIKGNGAAETEPVHPIPAPDRFLYTLGHKAEKPGPKDDVVLLIDFMGFSYDDSEIPDMERKGEQYNRIFQEVWIVHIGKGKCHNIF